MNPLVSIVITTYGGELVIERAVRSALNQSYSPIEIIVVDDNGKGTDSQVKTEKIVKNINENIIYIPHPENRNGSAARNTGINAAKGKYVALLDDDDSFRQKKIERQVSIMEDKGEEYAICYCGMEIHFPDGRKEILDTYYEGSVFEKAIMRQMHAQTSEYLLRRESALKIGGFDESFQRHQDWEFFDRMAYSYKVAVIPDVCIDRYILKRTAAKNARKYEDNRIHYLTKMKKYIEQLDENKRFELYDMHYSSICKEYIKEKKIKKAIQYLLKCKHRGKVLIKMWNDYVKLKGK